MQVPSWSVVGLADLDAGSCFLDDDSYGRRVAVAAAMEKLDGTEVFQWVDLYGEDPKARPIGLLKAVSRESAGQALHLADAEVDFDASDVFNLQSIHPYAHQAEKLGFRRPGALMIAGADYRVFAHSPAGELTVSLRDGSVHRGSTSGMIIVSRWRLIYRLGDRVREICRVEVGPES